MGKFSNTVAGFNELVAARVRATARDAVQETISEAQRVYLKGDASAAAVSKAISEQGGSGRMHVDTGFLRASIQASLNGMPSGPVQPRKGAAPGEYLNQQVGGAPVAAVLASWDPTLGETISIGWTANYARRRESLDGFLRGATELWDQTVDKAAKKAQRIG